MQFITEYLAATHTMTELAAAYGISRQTAYYWVRCYERDGPGRLAGASRRPHTSPSTTTSAVVDRLVAARQRHPTWGATKLRQWLVRREPATVWPCPDTIHEVLKRAGLTRRRRRPTAPGAAPRTSLTVPTAPNHVWTVDFKGQFRTGDGAPCYPLTLRDGYSRFVLRCTALAAPTLADTQRELARAFLAYGLPLRLRSDNGAPFAGPGLGRLSRLAVWCLRLGVVPEHITPGHPQQNGAHEQFHRVLKAETAAPPAASRAAQQRRFGHFLTEYNQDRPHHALAGASPAQLYTASSRRWTPRLPPLEYPSGWVVRRVSPSGQIRWAQRRLFLTSALAGEAVGFEPLDDGLWLVRFTTVPLAVFDERRHRLRTPDRAAPAQAPSSGEGPAPAGERSQ